MKLENWDDLRYLLALARHKTLTRSAQHLRVDQTTIARRLKSLQERTGVVLFERLRGGVIWTAAGESMVHTAQTIEETLLDLERRATGQELALAGPLRLTIPELLARGWMDQIWDFGRQHPQISLEIKASDSLKSLTRREADVALRVTQEPAEHLFGRHIGTLALAMYGAPSWKGHPTDTIPWIGWEPAGHESSMTERFRRAHGDAPYALWADSYMLMMTAAQHGVGAIVMPCIIGDKEPGLVRLTEPSPPIRKVWILTHEDLRHSPRVRALMAHITDFIQAQQDAMLGLVAPRDQA